MKALAEKAPGRGLPGAFFIASGIWLALVCGGKASHLSAEPDRLEEHCPPAGKTAIARLSRVVDGDTLRLADGRKLRLIGINTPELARDGRPPEPLAREAKAAAKVFLAGSRELHLAFGPKQRDHYGRTLAHVYRADGKSLEAHLLRHGLGFHIGVPPNLGGADCLAKVEGQARRQSLGVWSHAYWRPLQASQLPDWDEPDRAGGYHRVRGRIESVTENKYLWVKMEGPLVLRLDRKGVGEWSGNTFREWIGKTVEVRGWLIDRAYQTRKANRRYPRWRLDLRSKYGLNERI